MEKAMFGQLYSLIERIRTGSIVGLFCLLTTWVSRDELLVHGLWGVFVVCVAAVLVAYIVWAFRDPDRLQTEDYRLARHRMDVIGDERNPNDVPMIEAVPNTHVEASQAEVQQ
jgi:hypothetical protein